MTTDTQKTVRLIILIIVGIIIVYFVWTIFHKSKPPDNAYKELVAVKDSLIASKEETIKVIQELNAEKDKSIALHKQNDSLIKNRIAIINHKYETIPATVNSYDKSQLRDAISKY